MSDDNKAAGNVVNNVLQFPARKKEAEVSPATGNTGSAPGNAVDKAVPSASNVKNPVKNPEKKGSKKAMAATVLAIALLTVAVNKQTFEGAKAGNIELASNSGASIGRQIASVERVNWARNAEWEKQLAASMASAQVRDIASTGVGRSATIEEKRRWGILEEKYTITYSPNVHEINTILLQDPVSNPAYILDRSKFLTEYGRLFEGSFSTAKLKSVQKSDDKTVESYTLFDKENKARGEARFELDRHKRLISLKVEPVQI